VLNKKHLVIGCSVATVVVLGLFACGAYLVYRVMRGPLAAMSNVAPELKQPRVLVGDGLLTRDVFSNDHRLSGVQAMAFGPFETGQPDGLCAVSGIGALFLDADGATRRYTQYEMQRIKVFGMKLQAAGGRLSRFQIIDLGGNGESSFLARNNPMGSELIGHDGKSIWMLGTAMDIRSHPNDAVGGDLYGDGKTEFVATYYLGEKGVVLYDAALNEVWSRPEIRASHLELIDSEDGKKDIACSASSGLTILDAQGNVVRRLPIKSYANDFLILTWPSNDGSQYAVFRNQDSVDIYDLKGRLAFKCEVPNGKDLSRITAAAFMVGKVPYLAIVGSTASESRSILCVYGLPERPPPNQTVNESPLYDEVLGGSYQSIAKLPADDSGSEPVLIGGRGQILRYRPGSLPSEPPKQLKTNGRLKLF